MDSLSLGSSGRPKNYVSCVRHTPGWPGRPYMFSVGDNPEVFTANLINPYGVNPKNKVPPILGWITTGDNKNYSPQYFFEKIVKIGTIWKNQDQYCRFFTLYGIDGNVLKVRVFKPADPKSLDEHPLACFKEEGSNEGPVTFINKNVCYGRFIYAISAGDLTTAVAALRQDYDGVMYAYPCLGTMIDNLLKVAQNPKAVEWLNNVLSEKVDEENMKGLFLKDFQGLNLYTKELFNKKKLKAEKRYENGILAILSKVFAYVPRDL